MLKKPNFFILGAPKCGTTSLAFWLGEHPNIFMSKPKEPRYFNTDYAAPGRPGSLCDYENIFNKVIPLHKAIGEASTGYLRSKEAVPNILNYYPAARFIVCLRNPIDMVQSVHSQLVKMGTETETEFEHAWALQNARLKDECVPITCHDKKVLLYGQNCKLGKQVKRLFRIVHREQVVVIFLEDMKSEPKREYQRVQNFLGVDDDGRVIFPVKNSRAIPRFPFLSQGVRLVGLAKSRMGLRQGLGVGRIVSRFNNQPSKGASLSPEMKKNLSRYFEKDILLLGNILNRNLSSWIEGD